MVLAGLSADPRRFTSFFRRRANTASPSALREERRREEEERRRGHQHQLLLEEIFLEGGDQITPRLTLSTGRTEEGVRGEAHPGLEEEEEEEEEEEDFLRDPHVRTSSRWRCVQRSIDGPPIDECRTVRRSPAPYRRSPAPYRDVSLPVLIQLQVHFLKDRVKEIQSEDRLKGAVV
ncbi:hypothetical protein NQZ68_029261 [Dissostichus eleginoides]|nr:hypothetical protein NQZ68_029261 [Dissostichus eleginoides]